MKKISVAQKLTHTKIMCATMLYIKDEGSGTVISIESSNMHNFTKITVTDSANVNLIPQIGLVAQHENSYYLMLTPYRLFW